MLAGKDRSFKLQRADTGNCTMEGIRINNVVKSFGAVRALDGPSVDIHPGELFFLLGASGCGKTTLLRCIAGLESPDSGSIFFGDREVTTLPPHKREAALVFQSYALWPHLTVGQNIAFGLEERGLPRTEVRRQVAEALAMVKLPGLENRSIDQMSGGQQQRVSLARALVVKPKCLLLDEPLSNLDAQLRIEMRREIRRIVKDNGLTGIYVTHDQEEALAMADRLAILSQGRICQIGTPEEIYRSPHTPHVAGFIGETNLIAGKVIDVQPGLVRTETAAGPLTGRITAPGWIPNPGDPVCLSIRPEAWRLHPSGGENEIRGHVVERTYLGQRIQYEIDTPAGRQQVVEMNPHTIHDPGPTPLVLHAQREDVVVLPP